MRMQERCSQNVATQIGKLRVNKAFYVFFHLYSHLPHFDTSSTLPLILSIINCFLGLSRLSNSELEKIKHSFKRRKKKEAIQTHEAIQFF